jgi:hypothetical protein
MSAQTPPRDAPANHRHLDVRTQLDALPRGPAYRALLVTVMLGTSLCFATFLILRARTQSVRPEGAPAERPLPPPQQVAGVRAELFGIANPRAGDRERQRAVLESYGWVDRDRGLVRIPVRAAMELVVRSATGSPGHGAARGAP